MYVWVGVLGKEGGSGQVMVLSNLQCHGLLLIWITVGQGPTVLAVGGGRVFFFTFFCHQHTSFLSPSLWETARLRPDFTSKLVHVLAFGTPKFYIAPYDKIKHELVNQSSNCDMKLGLRLKDCLNKTVSKGS